jgi:hypothetical protein
MSGRTLERYLRVLDAPREVQDAFRSGRVSLVDAGRVAGLPAEAQKRLAADLRAGADPVQAVAARLAGKAPDPLHDALDTFFNSLERNLQALEPHVDQVRSLHPINVSTLERAQSLIGQLLSRVRKGPSPAAGRARKQQPQANEAFADLSPSCLPARGTSCPADGNRSGRRIACPSSGGSRHL